MTAQLSVVGCQLSVQDPALRLAARAVERGTQLRASRAEIVVGFDYAAADFGGAPSHPQTPVSEAPEPARRRSTVREPVAFPTNGGSSGSTPAPAPTEAAPDAPVPDHEADAENDRPRRTGWWAKRLMGDRG